jgi:hypothetical protein
VLVRTSVLIQYRTSGRDEATQDVDLSHAASWGRERAGGAVGELAIMLAMTIPLVSASNRA